MLENISEISEKVKATLCGVHVHFKVSVGREGRELAGVYNCPGIHPLTELLKAWVVCQCCVKVVPTFVSDVGQLCHLWVVSDVRFQSEIKRAKWNKTSVISISVKSWLCWFCYRATEHALIL